MAGPAKPPRNSSHMGIDHHPGDAESVAENNVGGFASDSRQRCQLLHGARYLTTMPSCQRLCGGDDVFRLVAVKTDGADVRRQFIHISFGKGIHIAIFAEEICRYLIHLNIGALCRKDGGDEEFKGSAEMKGNAGVRVGTGQGIENQQRPPATVVFLFQGSFLRMLQPGAIFIRPGFIFSMRRYDRGSFTCTVSVSGRWLDA